jgi:hypothetical protein
MRAWLARFVMSLELKQRRTTFTMLSVYLPKLFEMRRVESFPKTALLERTLWDVAIQIIGCPGSVVRFIFPFESGWFFR